MRLVAAADVALALAEKIGGEASWSTGKLGDLRPFAVAALLAAGAFAFDSAMKPRT
jgi:hypothetical protein